MATFTITALNTNIDSLSGKTGGDIYNVNGGQLVIDQDSRYGLNQTTSTSIAAKTISATLGGEVLIDGRNVRLIPYNAGAGVVPAANTVITQGGVTAKLIGVWSAVNVAPTAVGAAMPATGFLKVKQKAGGDYAAGALTGISASATGVDIVGWIDVVGDDAATANVPRLGTYKVLGEWYSLGTTSGVANQTFQVPTSGLSMYCPAIYIETAVASGVYEPFINAGSQTTVAADIRAKTFWYTPATGVVRLGHNGTANAGYTPIAGLRVVVGNVFLSNCTTAARTVNALPNATLATRYDFTTTSAGAIEMDKVTCNWYPSFAQAYSVSMTHTGVAEQINVSGCATEVTLVRVGVGQTAAQAQVAYVGLYNSAGTNFDNCHFSRATLAASGAYTVTDTYSVSPNFNNCTFTALTARGDTATGNVFLTRVTNAIFTTPKFINGRALFTTCKNPIITNASYVDVISGTTQTTAVQNACALAFDTFTSSPVLDGIDFLGLTNVQPYLGIVSFATGTIDPLVKNIGTATTPRDLGSVNASAVIYSAASGTQNVTLKRVYTSNTRTGTRIVDKSVNKLLEESVFSDYADASTIPVLNGRFKGGRYTTSLAAQASVYGTHFVDQFISATEGRVTIYFNEKTSVSPSAESYTVTAGTPKFTSAGTCVMGVIGDQIEYELPYFALGHTGFVNAAPVMAGGTIGNYLLEYQIDKNDGAGYSAWATMSGANLSAETGIDPALGIKLKIRITTSTTNTAGISSLYVRTVSDTTAQQEQYPLETISSSFTVTNLIAGTTVVLLRTSDNVEINRQTTAGSTYVYNYDWNSDDGNTGVYALFWNPDYQIQKVTGLTLTSSAQSIPVSLAEDLIYNAVYTDRYSIDYTARVITMNSGETNYDVQGAYSKAKDDYLLTNNAQYEFPFTIVGGNDIVTGFSQVPYYTKLASTWQVQPDSADHTLSVTNGVLLSTASNPFLNSTGFTVQINYQQPVQAISVSTSGSAITPSDVWGYSNRTLNGAVVE